MPATFDEATALQAPYLNRIPLDQTGYSVNVDDPQGCMIRFTGDGVAVYMLFREPGIYYNDHARRVPEELAIAAGYDTIKWGKARRRVQAKRDAMAAIDADFEDRDQVRVICEASEYRVVEIAPGYCNIEFVDDTAPPQERYTILNARGPVSEEVALRRFAELTGSAPAEASQPVDADVEKPTVKRAK